MIECSKVWQICKHPGDTISSKSTFYCGWAEALQWIKRELHAARDSFEPDLGLHSLLRRELGEEYNRKT